ncbi:D-aminoacyl-tRNA deacylase [Methanococcoides methylutens]|uniref:D-aminoacyl-tRNA deacylase n=1 Tax=Methanococcoides methylutens MM1 TaxID=1434104 RepID=A0A0E3SQB4_METMT|nr:D-aminoacyl-tRNA deacylase [Methanococcoides methylutens]AKB84218.1 D-tyrosyl-tRNA(Tyr) deacylase [Methanococcoides methylutens MM1]
MQTTIDKESPANIVIICSTVDMAGQNIKGHLLKLRDWGQLDVPSSLVEDVSEVYESGNFRIVEVKEHHIYQDGIDRKLKEAGLPCDFIIFASKHRSADGRRLLTSHFTGNPGSADFGGNPGELAMTAPFALRSILFSMSEKADEIGFDVSMESTHHGPSDLSVPSVYAEIGSSESEWVNTDAGAIVARAILGVRQDVCPVVLGFGGGHYAARQTNLIFGSDVTFGHNFPDYQIQHVDEELFRQAVEKSGADLVYCDRKSMSSKDRKKISDLADASGLELLRESDIMEMKGLNLNDFRIFLDKVREQDPSGRVKFSEGIRKRLNEERSDELGRDDVSVTTVNLDPQLIKLTKSVDLAALKEVLQSSDMVYFELGDATVSNVFFTFWKQDAESFLTFMLNECIKILKERYDTEYIFDENVLCITDDRFNPDLARKMGVLPGPMFGKLAGGEPVTVDGRTIEPGMVRERVKKSFVLNNAIF